MSWLSGTVGAWAYRGEESDKEVNEVGKLLANFRKKSSKESDKKPGKGSDEKSSKELDKKSRKAKVMSYEDIEEARAKRAAKEVIKGKGKRGRKRKSAALEADEPELEPGPEVARMIEAAEPWRAPVVRMI
ncbi:hypothetical protein G7Y89_g11935 [Cudoniella acicularis]|uniref:Uncharacterized protein n=1 Tax=Cudoniella acicularis TaxID=354080 RepID=A0A8H4R9W2_9HELO|nr:hypothetical protein G7Y89_g11935 [Cudoniella acicularis]